jgi:uncharacterized membrane protein YgdD (TMEM256/DUF423 family)
MERLWIGLGSLAGLTTVAMAAVAAHGMSGLDAGAIGMVRGAVQMQGWHALALIGCGLWAPRGGLLANLAGAAFALGLVLFCGSLYALALGGVSLGLLAPAGAITLMIGWALLGLSALRAR